MQNTLEYKNLELFIGAITSWKHYHGKNWAKKLCHYVTDLVTRVDKLPVTPGKFVTPHQPAPFKNM